MINRILEMDCSTSFISVSRDLVLKDKQRELADSLTRSAITLSSEAMWTPEELNAKLGATNGITEALKFTAGEDDSAKLLHRLQILGYANPGIHRFIQQFLQRACV